MAEIELEGVSKSYSGHGLAVDRLSLTVGDGELLVLVGPSGCGKSTTLRLIAGLERPSAGRVRIAGRVVNDESPRRRNIAMVFQNHALFPHLSVAENMAFGRRMRDGGWWRRLFSHRQSGDVATRQSETRQRVADVARLLGVAQLLSRRPWQLSGGQRQRVALGQAVVRQPAAFLLDEPLSNLDAALKSELRSELKKLQGRLRTTTIYVTHDTSEALTLGDRVAVMEAGRLHQVDRPSALYRRPKNRRVAAILGSSPMNFVEGTLVRGQSPWRFQAAGWAVDVTPDAVARRAGRRLPDRVVLGARPEDVLMRPSPQPLENAGQSAAGAAIGRVTMVEFIGDASMVHVELPGADGSAGDWVLSKASADCPLRPGEAAEVRFCWEHAVWFDCESGDNLDGPGHD